MTVHDDRLVQCFAAVFPTLSEAEIRACDVTALLDLDSLAGVTLITSIDQVFGKFIDFPVLLKLGSFEAISRFLQEQNAPGVPAHE
jgi:acyl carrier protein